VAPRVAPRAEDYLRYQSERAAGRAPRVRYSPDGHPLSLTPLPFQLPHLQKQPGVAARFAAATLPSSYDLRSLNKVSPVKNQLWCGDCWAFATMGSLESSLLPGQSWNFSENHLDNLAGDTLCEGGNGYQSTAYLARWQGPVTQAADPDPVACTSTDSCFNLSPSNLAPSQHVQQAVYIAARQNSLDNGNLKSAVMNLGGVYVTLSADELGGTDPY
jgi:C1A family cysteine protease